MERKYPETIILLILLFPGFLAAGCVDQKVYGVGQTVSDGPLEFTVNDIRSPTIGIKHLTSPGDGNRYLVANVTITNTGNSEYTLFNSLYNVVITDETGTAYPVDQFRSGYLATGWHDGTFSAGESRTGLLIYEVPASSRKFELDFFYPSQRSHVAAYAVDYQEIPFVSDE